MDWNAKMPRDKPEAGKAQIVIAIKTADGRRTEYSGTVDAALAEDLFRRATRKTDSPCANPADRNR